MSEKIKVISATSHKIGVTVPSLHFSREWPNKNYAVLIEKEVLADLMYDQGFRYMIQTGMLFIEDMGFKKEQGIEPETATVPENVLFLGDTEKNEWLNKMDITTFKDRIRKLSFDQINELVNYAVANHIVDYEKSKILKKQCGRDIIKLIELEGLGDE